MPKSSLPPRPLTQQAATALDIIVSSGSRAMHVHDLQLRMHQRGFDARACSDALRAFERRHWLVKIGSTIEITEIAFATNPVVPKKKPRAKRLHAWMPRGLFGG